ncbi:MAG: DUF1330 domain-containing protein [Pseudomonadota bacterium]
MPAYMIARIKVTDADQYAEYAAQTVALAEQFGGTFLVKGGPMKQLEGDGPDRHVVVRFDTMAAAEAWYASDAYQKILPIALSNSHRDIVLVEGI